MAQASPTSAEFCMYCALDAGTEIDHFRPKANFPSLAFTWLNYLWSCSACNSAYKKNKFPLDPANQPLLIDPTQTDPHHHLTFSPSTGQLGWLTEQGRETINTLGLNSGTRPNRRGDNFRALQSHIAAYDDALHGGDGASAQIAQRLVRHMPCAFLLGWLLQHWQHPSLQGVVTTACRVALRGRPEIETW